MHIQTRVYCKRLLSICLYSTFLGYKKGANPGDMEIVEEEAIIVRRIYDEYLAGKSPGEIAKRLTADGIPTPAKKTKWHPSTIISILHNEKYRGDAKLQKCFTTSFLDHIVVRNMAATPVRVTTGNCLTGIGARADTTIPQ